MSEHGRPSRVHAVVSALLTGACRPLIALGLTFWLFAAYRGVAPVHSGDQGVWLDSAYGADLTRLWLGVRPPLVPAVHRLFAYREEWIVWLQLGLSCVASFCFSQQVASWIGSRRLGSFTFATLSLWLVLDWNDWSFTIRSEALSHAALLLLFACTLGWGRAWLSHRRRALWGWTLGLCASALGCTTTRDTMAYLVLWLALAIPLGSMWSLRRFALPHLRVVIALSAALTLIGWSSLRSNDASGRHLRPLDHLIVGRVLRVRERLGYFRDQQGMPTPKELLLRRPTGPTARLDFDSEPLAQYGDWLREHGASAYRAYLLSHPLDAWSRTLETYPIWLNYDYRAEYLAVPRGSLAKVRSLARQTRPRLAVAVGLTLLAGVVCASLLFANARRARWFGALGVSALVGSLLLAFVSVNGDAMEVPRHGAAVGVLARDVVLPFGLVAGMVWLGAWLGRSTRFPRAARWARSLGATGSPGLADTTAPARTTERTRKAQLAHTTGVQRWSSRLGWALVVAVGVTCPWLPGLAREPDPTRAPRLSMQGTRGDAATLFDDDVDRAAFCLEPHGVLELRFAVAPTGLKILRAIDATGALSVRGFDARESERLHVYRPGRRGWPNPAVLQLDELRGIRRFTIEAGAERQCLTEVRAH
ncbi:MAG TPA: hypothetical protein VLC09_15760 [Polyangiaceae bacterium]|nr:hypothetical protein [Polyangiaceae bacterium]